MESVVANLTGANAETVEPDVPSFIITRRTIRFGKVRLKLESGGHARLSSLGER